MSLTAFGKTIHFIQSLNLPIEVASVLFESEEDCHQFLKGFYKKNKYVVDDLLDYREYKIGISQKTLDLFVKECYDGNMRQAFQSTFYQFFSEDDMDMIEQAILNGDTSPAQLFVGFQNNPNKNILRYIL